MKKPINPNRRLLTPIREFIHAETTGGIVLFATAVIAMFLANSLWSDTYLTFWKKQLTIGFGSWALSKPLALWINDGLMVIFFFVVGLEIKREILAGELSTIKKSMLPVFAALGGMVVPAMIYMFFNHAGEGRNGWGIPMATDIAFALGLLLIFGKSIPISLKIFLTALAIVDDLGAVLVIALFYTSDLYLGSLVVGLIAMSFLLVMNYLEVRKVAVYVIFGILMWYAFLKSGIHPTLAGVLLAFTIPSRVKIDANDFPEHCRKLINEFEDAGDCAKPYILCEAQQTAVQSLELACHYAQSPMQRLETNLHSWVMFLVMPVFAIANAGIVFNQSLFADALNPVTLGVFFGLAIGKPLGITLFSWVAVKAGLARLPEDLNWKMILGVSCVAGIGFTMSIFISDLAFESDTLMDMSKLGIFSASIFAGVTGWLILKSGKTKNTH